jgi:hypothetical protein
MGEKPAILTLPLPEALRAQPEALRAQPAEAPALQAATGAQALQQVGTPGPGSEVEPRHLQAALPRPDPKPPPIQS